MTVTETECPTVHTPHCAVVQERSHAVERLTEDIARLPSCWGHWSLAKRQRLATYLDCLRFWVQSGRLAGDTERWR